MPRMPLQQAVRKIRARLAVAQREGDRPIIVACISDLRAQADRAADEGKRGTFISPAVGLLRDLADKTERELEGLEG